MSKFRNLLGGLAGIGLLAALAVTGVSSGQTTSPHVASFQADAVAMAATASQPGCLNCLAS
jgi:hypothetical protein